MSKAGISEIYNSWKHVVIFNRRKNGLCPHSPFSRKDLVYGVPLVRRLLGYPQTFSKGTRYWQRVLTGRLLKYKQPYIHTDQTAFLRTELFDMGYRIFLHYANGAVMEIKLGDNPQPVGPLTASSDLQSILFPDGHLKHPVIC